jgi:hypothetical protein
MVDVVFVLAVIAIVFPILKWLANDKDHYEPPHFPDNP